MTTGGKVSLTFDTHSNSLPAAQGKTFVFPTPDKYVVTMTLYPGRDVQTPVDTKTLAIEVTKAPSPATTRAGTRPR